MTYQHPCTEACNQTRARASTNPSPQTKLIYPNQSISNLPSVLQRGDYWGIFPQKILPVLATRPANYLTDPTVVMPPWHVHTWTVTAQFTQNKCVQISAGNTHMFPRLNHLPPQRLIQGCTNTGRQIAAATTICNVAHNICGSPVWNLLQCHLVAPRILKRLLYFLKICASIF